MKATLITLFFILPFWLYANDKEKKDKEFGLVVEPAVREIRLDGNLEPGEWDDAEYNKIDMPEPYNDAQLWLVGPRMDVSFTDKLFLSTFVQYNNQIENVNINTRFQWRFKPVSDLFVVYTDNYHPESFQIKNRALILKLTYWINV